LRETYDLFFSFNFQLEKLFPVYSGHNTTNIYAKLRRDILLYRNESSTYASDPKQKTRQTKSTVFDLASAQEFILASFCRGVARVRRFFLIVSD
jgi:hypothetical protein